PAAHRCTEGPGDRRDPRWDRGRHRGAGDRLPHGCRRPAGPRSRVQSPGRPDRGDREEPPLAAGGRVTTTLTATLLGVLLAAGLLCIWSSFWEPPVRTRARSRFVSDLADDLVAADLPRVSPGSLLLVCAGTGVLVWLLSYAL